MDKTDSEKMRCPDDHHPSDYLSDASVTKMFYVFSKAGKKIPEKVDLLEMSDKNCTSALTN